MEEMLVGIAGLLLGRAELSKVGIIMYSIVNFNTWLSIIGDLFAQDTVYITLLPKWNKLSSRLRGLKETRDRLAHHTIYYGDNASTIPSDTSLRPGRFDFRKNARKYQPPDFSQISIFKLSLDQIHNELTMLLKTMTDLLNTDLLNRENTSQKKSSELNPDPHHP
jgi:hypothetical protein